MDYISLRVLLFSTTALCIHHESKCYCLHAVCLLGCLTLELISSDISPGVILADKCSCY